MAIARVKTTIQLFDYTFQHYHALNDLSSFGLIDSKSQSDPECDEIQPEDILDSDFPNDQASLFSICPQQATQIDWEEIQWLKESVVEHQWVSNVKYNGFFRRQMIEQHKALQDLKKEITNEFGNGEYNFRKMQIRQLEDHSKAERGSGTLHDKKEYILINKRREKLTMLLTEQDLNKLLPGNDLNDTIILNYINLLKMFILPKETANSTHFFSTYLVEKLMREIVEMEPNIDLLKDEACELTKRIVCENYLNVKRWTRKDDIFSKDVLVFPINMFNHWFCVLVNNPGALLDEGESSRREGESMRRKGQSPCQIIFCDSMFEKRKFVVTAIRTYLQLQLFDKKHIFKELDATTIPDYQLLLPRQTNTHDCGLYMLTYIQELLMNKSANLAGLSTIENRLKLSIIPRIYLESSRIRVIKLLVSLYQEQLPKRTQQIVKEFLAQRKAIYANSQTDDEFFDHKEFEKYQALHQDEREPVKLDQEGRSTAATDNQANELRFLQLVRFYYSSEINFYSQEDHTRNKERLSQSSECLNNRQSQCLDDHRESQCPNDLNNVLESSTSQ